MDTWVITQLRTGSFTGVSRNGPAIVVGCLGAHPQTGSLLRVTMLRWSFWPMIFCQPHIRLKRGVYARLVMSRGDS